MDGLIIGRAHGWKDKTAGEYDGECNQGQAKPEKRTTHGNRLHHGIKECRGNLLSAIGSAIVLDEHLVLRYRTPRIAAIAISADPVA
jgi:hypothetical protein